MAQLIVAQFNNQFAATAAVSKLLGNGVSRDQITVEVHARFMDTPVGAPAPTHPIPLQSDHENSTHRGRTTDDAISPRFGAAPEEFGHSVVTVAISDDLDADPLRRMFEADGASSVETRDGELPPHAAHEQSGSTKVGHSVTDVDRQRAIDASRGGAALDESLHRSDVDPLAETGKSSAQQADDHQIKSEDAS